MPRPSGDASTGWWSIRIRQPDGSRRKVPLMKQPGWTRERPAMPKRPPHAVEAMARKYQDMHARVAHGMDVTPLRATDVAGFLGGYRDAYAADHAANSARALRVAVAHFLDHCRSLGVTKLQAISPATCEGYMRARREAGAARATVVTERRYLSAAWTPAVRDRLVPANPWRDAVVPGRGRVELVAFWTREELDRLVAACPPWLRDIVLVAANTGGRITSILTLGWAAVSFDRNVVKLDVKTDPYEVPLTPVARAVFARLREGRKGPLVFPSSRSGKPRVAATVNAAIRRAVAKAGVPEKGRYCHILRHTFASHAVMAGVPLATVSKWLGHKSIGVTMIYFHLCPNASQEHAGKFSLGSTDVNPPPSPTDEAN